MLKYKNELMTRTLTSITQQPIVLYIFTAFFFVSGNFLYDPFQVVLFKIHSDRTFTKPSSYSMFTLFPYYLLYVPHCLQHEFMPRENRLSRVTVKQSILILLIQVGALTRFQNMQECFENSSNSPETHNRERKMK